MSNYLLDFDHNLIDCFTLLLSTQDLFNIATANFYLRLYLTAQQDRVKTQMIVQQGVCSVTQRATAENSPLAVASWWTSKLDMYVNDKVRIKKNICWLWSSISFVSNLTGTAFNFFSKRLQTVVESFNSRYFAS